LSNKGVRLWSEFVCKDIGDWKAFVDPVMNIH
jgi:hypothetical protein